MRARLAALMTRYDDNTGVLAIAKDGRTLVEASLDVPFDDPFRARRPELRRGHLPLDHPAGMEAFLFKQGIRIADFKATGISAKLSGWALLVYDALWSRRLLNVEVDEHQYGAIWGGVPLIACDVFEHAYYHKDGPGRAKYIDNFLGNLHWGRINDRFKKFVR